MTFHGPRDTKAPSTKRGKGSQQKKKGRRLSETVMYLFETPMFARKYKTLFTQTMFINWMKAK